MNYLHGKGKSTIDFGYAWMGLASAIGIHVLDEALHDFLLVYNPMAIKIKSLYSWLPVPVFTFEVWLVSLCLGISVLLLLSPWAFRGARWLIFVSIPLAVLMFINGTAHLLSSILLRRWMPGVLSSPLLMAAAVWLFLKRKSLANERWH
jgi:hypothetical protein